MSNTIFKTAEAEEVISQIEELGAEIWNEHYIKIISQDQIDYMLKKFQSKESIKKQIEENYEYYLIKHNCENAGYTAILSKTNYMFLSKLYIKAEKRGLGIAKQTLNFIKEKCAEKNLKSIRLTVHKRNPSLEAYKKIGFKILEPIVTDIGNGYVMDDYNMEYTIN